MLACSKWEKLKIGPAIVMLKNMIKALGGFKATMQFFKDVKVGGISLDDKLKKEKKGLFEGGNARSFAGISRTRLYEKAYGICL